MAKFYQVAILATVAGASALLTARPMPSREPKPSVEPPPGYRSVTLPVDSLELQSIHADDRIDVLVTFSEARLTGPAERAAQTLLQNVRVLDVRVPASLQGQGAVYVALNPYEAQFAVLAAEQKKIHITVRSKADAGSRPMEVVRMTKLFK